MSQTTIEVFIYENRQYNGTMPETVQDNIGVNIGIDASRQYAMYGYSDSDRVHAQLQQKVSLIQTFLVTQQSKMTNRNRTKQVTKKITN